MFLDMEEGGILKIKPNFAEFYIFKNKFLQK